jgi:hypothetical protein
MINMDYFRVILFLFVYPFILFLLSNPNIMSFHINILFIHQINNIFVLYSQIIIFTFMSDDLMTNFIIFNAIIICFRYILLYHFTVS